VIAALRDGVPVDVEASAPLAPSGGSLREFEDVADPPYTPAEAAQLLAGYYADADIGRALRGIIAMDIEADRAAGHVRDLIAENNELRTYDAGVLTQRDLCEIDLRDARAIIEGRDVPPTEAEIAAHEAAGGTWLFFEMKNAEGQPLHDAAPVVADHEFNAYEAREGQMLLGHAVRWWPLDADGRPCAWPSVTK
jgi:hypothetical protein